MNTPSNTYTIEPKRLKKNITEVGCLIVLFLVATSGVEPNEYIPELWKALINALGQGDVVDYRDLI